MAKSDANAGSKTKPPVRLRKPDRLQAVMSVSCSDELAESGQRFSRCRQVGFE